MNIYKWKILEKKSKKEKNIKRKTKDIIEILLKNRGIIKKKEKDEFLKPKKPQDYNPEEVGISSEEIKSSIKRIGKAIKNKQKTIIYGDYDADGVCATAILWLVLYKLNKNTLPFIPDRFSQGYAINKKGIDSILKKNPDTKLIITVDNGIVANDALSYAKKKSIDVIITDHHQKSKKTPKAHSIIHTTQISGSGVAFFLAKQVVKKYKMGPSKLNSLLDLLCIGTVSDQMSLIGFNRSAVKYGISALQKTKRPGLLALYKMSGIDPKTIDTYHINFVISPRINASGRLKSAIDSLRLLCTNNENYAYQIAQKLGRLNKERQNLVEEMTLHARSWVDSNTLDGSIIVVSHKNYHEGVIGLIASKMVEIYYRPAIVIAQGDSVSKGSARSIIGFDINKAIKEMKDLIIEGGGHSMAAGFSIENQKIDSFSKEIKKLFDSFLSENIVEKKLNIDLEIDFDEINWELDRAINLLKPFGIGNPTPLFVTKKVKVTGVKKIGANGNHLRLYAQKDGINFQVIAFNKGDLYESVIKKELVDVAYRVEENNWNGVKSIQLNLKDIR